LKIRQYKNYGCGQFFIIIIIICPPFSSFASFLSLILRLIEVIKTLVIVLPVKMAKFSGTSFYLKSSSNKAASAAGSLAPFVLRQFLVKTAETKLFIDEVLKPCHEMRLFRRS